MATCVRCQHRYVSFGVRAGNDSGGGGAVRESHLNLISSLYNVQGGQDFGVGIDDNAAADAISLAA